MAKSISPRTTFRCICLQGYQVIYSRTRAWNLTGNHLSIVYCLPVCHVTCHQQSCARVDPDSQTQWQTCAFAFVEAMQPTTG